MSMLGFVYLVLILGWILIVLFLKCKKSISPHIGLADNYADAVGSDERRQSIHVIQLQRDELENEDQFMRSYRQQSSSLGRHNQRLGLSTIGVHNLTTVFTPEDIINPAYSHDEEYVINTPPPSYDEVMRQPEVYPKVNNKFSEVNT